MKRLLPIIIAALLAAFASVGIVRWAQNVSEETQIASIMVAADDLDKGDPLSVADMRTQTVRVPSDKTASGRAWRFIFEQLTPEERQGTLEGRKLAEEVKRGTPILESMLMPITQDRARRNWKTGIDRGKRAISIPVGNKYAVSGLIEVGDHVDVLVNIEVPEKGGEQETTIVPVPMGDTITNIEIPTNKRGMGAPMTVYLMQDVEILSVGNQPYRTQDLDPDDLFQSLGAIARPGGESITVALTPAQAQLIVFAMANGNSEFVLTLRTPDDHDTLDLESMPPATFDTLSEFVGAGAE